MTARKAFANCDVHHEAGSIEAYVCDVSAENWRNYLERMSASAKIIDALTNLDARTVGVLRNMAVAAEHRGKGHGTRLVEAVMERFEAEGADVVFLFADMLEENAFDLKAWYERLGFEAIDFDPETPCMAYGDESLILDLQVVAAPLPTYDPSGLHQRSILLSARMRQAGWDACFVDLLREGDHVIPKVTLRGVSEGNPLPGPRKPLESSAASLLEAIGALGRDFLAQHTFGRMRLDDGARKPGCVTMERNGEVLVGAPRNPDGGDMVFEDGYGYTSGPLAAESIAASLSDLEGFPSYLEDPQRYDRMLEVLGFLPTEPEDMPGAVRVLLDGRADLQDAHSHQELEAILKARLYDSRHGIWPDGCRSEWDEVVSEDGLEPDPGPLF